MKYKHPREEATYLTHYFRELLLYPLLVATMIIRSENIHTYFGFGLLLAPSFMSCCLLWLYFSHYGMRFDCFLKA